jgi:DNA-binding transcriptional ArsR family regulator
MIKKHNWVNVDLKKFNFNHIDMLIILVVGKYEAEKNSCSVANIRNSVDIAPNNLTVHIKKLEEMEILKIKNEGRGKKKEISLNWDNQKSACLITGVLDYFLLDQYSEEELSLVKENTQSMKKSLQHKAP